jgi:hypothetical protein
MRVFDHRDGVPGQHYVFDLEGPQFSCSLSNLTNEVLSRRLYEGCESNGRPGGRTAVVVTDVEDVEGVPAFVVVSH